MNHEIICAKSGVCNCYIIKGNKNIILIDSGMNGVTKGIEKELHRNNIKKGDIVLLILTHCHWDHIGNVRYLAEKYGVPMAVSSSGKRVIEEGLAVNPPGITAWGNVLGKLLRRMSKKMNIPACDVGLEIDKEEFSLNPYGIAGKVVHTPGHSEDSVSVILDSGEAFVGDAAMNGLPLRIGPGWPVFASDEHSLVQSWQKILQYGTRKIFPAHGKPFDAKIMQQELAGRKKKHI